MTITRLLVAVTIAMTSLSFGADIKPGSCCDKAKKAGKECTHPCCVKATKDGKVCEKCNK
jgi:hypothetical protein